MVRTLTLRQAQRVALAAQGLHQGKPTSVKRRSQEDATAQQDETNEPSLRALKRTFARLQLVQIDSVNVLTRSHYLPFFSRLGPYDRALLDKLTRGKNKALTEFWAHEASYIRPEHFSALRHWQYRAWISHSVLAEADKAELESSIAGALARSRPLSARALAQKLGQPVSAVKEHWGWNRTPVKHVLEDLFARGLIGVDRRNAQFERLYTSLDAAMPEQLRGEEEATEKTKEEGLLTLIEASARAHGIGTVDCFADYFRLPKRSSARALDILEARGVVEKVDVAGLKPVFYLYCGTKIPRHSDAKALVSPFDSMVFNRNRLELLFSMRHRIGIYTPEAQRTHGYYTLPFVLGQDFVARVDLKADRARGTLLVQGAWAQDGAPENTSRHLGEELMLMAQWLGLDRIELVNGEGLLQRLRAEI